METTKNKSPKNQTKKPTIKSNNKPKNLISRLLSVTDSLGMKQAELIVEKKLFIEIAFLIVTLICLLCIPFVKVNYDLTEYLPGDAKSKVALNIMENEFGFPGTARVMIENVSIYEAFVYKQRMEAIPGVEMVIWPMGEVYMTQEFLMMDQREDFYKDGCAVMDIAFEDGDSADTTKAAVQAIQDLLGDRARYAGTAVENKSLEETLQREMAMVMGLALLLITLILTLTTTSWVEPFLFLSIMGIAIVINMGTNLIFGTISFLSNSIAALLQLATSMDYSVFLLHTFIRCRQSEDDPKKAMTTAIYESSTSILSSAMTTFMGFIALCTMRFGLGRDVGLVLGKSIICSVLTVMLLMPAFLIRFGGLVEKTRHRSFVPGFSGISKLLCTLKIPVIVIIIVITPFCYTAQNMNRFTFGNAALGRSKGTRTYEDTRAIEDRFGRSNLYLMVLPNETPIKERKLCEELSDLYYVKTVLGISYTMPGGIPESFIPDSLREKFRTRDYTRLLIYTKTDTETDLAFESCAEMESIMKSYYPKGSYLVGNTPSTIDLKELMVPDYAATNIISLLAVGLVVAITFKSLFLAVLVLVPICVATYVNMTIPYLVGESFMFNGFMIVSCIQLGATVDYSILLTGNYLTERSQGLTTGESAVAALNKSLLSMLTSGSILTVVGYGLYMISTVAAISSLGHLVGRGAFISLIMVALAVPALVSTADPLIRWEKNLVSRVLQRIRPG